MKRDINHLLDMLTAIQLIQGYTLGKSQQDLVKDQLLQDAVTRRIEILGEATRRFIDLDIVWRVIQQELPVLLPILEREIAKRTKEL